MKVALVHDFLSSYGGAERVLEALHEIWPKAPVYTAFYKPEGLGVHKNKFASWRIRASWAQKIPFIERLASPLRIFAPFMWNFDFLEYGVVISSTNMYFAKNVNVFRPSEARRAKGDKRPLHFCYCHTPPRSLWGYGMQSERGLPGKIYEAIFNPYLRFMDKKAAQKPDYFIANSQEVKNRIKRFYNRDAVVINPPVNIAKRDTRYAKRPPAGEAGKRQDGNYYLVVSRLFVPKRVNLAILAANKLGIPLKVVGAGVQGEALHRMAGRTVELLGEVSDEKLAGLYAGCKAVLFLAKDEDFGIVPAEAMSFGKPVIGANSGGVPETIMNGKTGILIDEPLTVERVVGAIKKLEKTKFSSKTIAQYAQRFSKERFKKEVESFVKSKLKNA